MILIKGFSNILQLTSILMDKEKIMRLVFLRRHLVVFSSGHLTKDSFRQGHIASFCKPAIWKASQRYKTTAIFQHLEFIWKFAVSKRIKDMIHIC